MSLPSSSSSSSVPTSSSSSPSPSLSDSQYDDLLELTDAVRSALDESDINAATRQAEELHAQLRDVQKTLHIQEAHNWLNDALEKEPLMFDIAKARAYLNRWETVIDDAEDNSDFRQYRERVDTMQGKKTRALQVRGVIAHCDELLNEAASLERGDEPPHPNFLMTNYYDKAYAIVTSAQSDYSNHADLDRMVQRVERVYNQKDTAADIYEMALSHRKYTNALHNIDQLPDDVLVPRYTATETSDGEIKLQYQTMVSVTRARQEIEQLAQNWATERTRTAIRDANQQLDAHAPSDAVETLQLGENVSRFLPDPLQQELDDMQTKARTSLRNRQKAQERIAKAIDLADENPLAAWDEYASAYHMYQWADNINTARQAVIKAMRANLRTMLSQADDAFHQQRDMEKVRQLYQKARTNYADKDSALDELLAELSEYNEMTKHYDEYVKAGRSIIQKVRDALWDDAVAANDLLSQVESYPDIVLEELSEVYELRQTVNQRLNADHRYSELYPMIYNEASGDVRQAINDVQDAATEFPDDKRFPALLQTLQEHFGYLSAKEQAQSGEAMKALQLLGPVLNNPNHPDYSAAQQLRQQLNAPTNNE